MGKKSFAIGALSWPDADGVGVGAGAGVAHVSLQPAAKPGARSAVVKVQDRAGGSKVFGELVGSWKLVDVSMDMQIPAM